jgi:hypothetical protein
MTFEGGREHGMAGGRRRKHRSGKHRSSKRSSKHRSSKHRGGKRSSRRNAKGGEGVLATAAVPFGLLALQRYFKGSKTSKQGINNLGNTFKRTFRRKH